MIASTAIIANHVQMAALTLKREMLIESKEMAGIVKPRTRNKRIVVGYQDSPSSRSG